MTFNKEILDKGGTMSNNGRINFSALMNAFEEKSSISHKIEKIARDAGFENVDADSEADERFFFYMDTISNILGYESVNDIAQSLQSKTKELKLYFEKLISLMKQYQQLTNDEHESNEYEPWKGNKNFYLALAMLFLLNPEQLSEFSTKSGWDNDIFHVVKKSISISQRRREHAL